MRRIVNNIISVILAISMILCTNMINVNAQEKSTQLSKGQYLIINSKKNKLGYFKDGVLVKEFSVATGKSSTPTPQGKFKVVNKIKNRPYYSGGISGGSPNNPLGDRWLGLHVGATYGTTYAIHGNNNESSIGKHISGGCIRMHNSEVRWLFDQISVGAYAIIDYSDKSFIQIASKYGVTLSTSNTESESQNIINLKKVYKEFTTYNGIDLLNKNSTISNIDDVENILSSKSKYINAYNKLNSNEKNNKNVKEINTNFNRIVEILEFAQASIRFYNNISINAEYIFQDVEWSRRLNTHYSDELGTRGKALKEYNDVVVFETKDNSARIKYLDKIYTESVFFLNAVEYIYNGDIDSAKLALNLVTDSKLNSIISSEIKKQSDIIGHWAESNIKQAMEDGWIDKSNIFRPNDSITRAEFVKIVNRKFGFNIIGHWAESNIKQAMEDGWIDKSNIFRPNDSITRAEFVKIVNRKFGFKDTEDITFTDVDENSWYYNEVKIAVKAGYINGNGDNTFSPNKPITREEVAVIVTSIMNNKQENLEKIFQYEDYAMISPWATSSFEGVVSNGYMGVSETHLRPKDKITRSESIVTLQRVK